MQKPIVIEQFLPLGSRRDNDAFEQLAEYNFSSYRTGTTVESTAGIFKRVRPTYTTVHKYVVVLFILLDISLDSENSET